LVRRRGSASGALCAEWDYLSDAPKTSLGGCSTADDVVRGAFRA